MPEQAANNGQSPIRSSCTTGRIYVRVPHHSPYELFFDETTTVEELREVFLASVNSASEAPGFVPWTDCRLVRRGVELKTSNNRDYVVRNLHMEDGEHIHGMLVTRSVPSPRSQYISSGSLESQESAPSEDITDYNSLDEVRRSLANILMTIRQEEMEGRDNIQGGDGSVRAAAARRQVERVLQASPFRRQLNHQPTSRTIQGTTASNDSSDLTLSIPVLMYQLKKEHGIRGIVGFFVGAFAPTLALVACICVSVVTLPSEKYGYIVKYRVSQPKRLPPMGPAAKSLYEGCKPTQPSHSYHTAVHIRERGAEEGPTSAIARPSVISCDYTDSVIPVFFAPYRPTYTSLTSSEGHDALMVNGHFTGGLRFSLGLLLGICVNLLVGIFTSFATYTPIKVSQGP